AAALNGGQTLVNAHAPIDIAQRVGEALAKGDRGALRSAIDRHALPDECKDGLTTLSAQVELALGTIELNERLTHQAYHDPLTKLGNRALLAEHARGTLATDCVGT